MIPKRTIIFTLLSLFVSVSLSDAQENAKILELYQKIQRDVLILSDGKNTSYGMYLARHRNKKSCYVVADNRLSIGIEGKILVQLLNGDVKRLVAEKFDSNAELNLAIYKIESLPKHISTIKRIPQDFIRENLEVYVLGNPKRPEQLTKFNLRNVSDANSYELVGPLSETYLGGPCFDNKGRIAAAIGFRTQAGSKESQSVQYDFFAIPIARILDYASVAFKDLELSLIWREEFPTQLIIDQVKESVALIENIKGGAGIFLGRDKQQTGYILTANHVVSEDESLFSVRFVDDPDGKELGSLLSNAFDEKLDLAIVKVENCPEVKPITFIRDDSLKKFRKFFTPHNVASIGYGGPTLWRQRKGRLNQLRDNFFITNLPVGRGDSGGPLFNKNGELLGLNLKTAPEEKTQGRRISVAVTSKSILKFLGKKIGHIDFQERWGFLDYPTFWQKNRLWILSLGAASVSGGIGIAASILGDHTPPRQPLEGVPSFPGGN